jgi:RHS repeat-associated protein
VLGNVLGLVAGGGVPADRQRQACRPNGTVGSKEDSYYTYPLGDVEAVTDTAGNTRDTYGYTAYGKDDNQQFTGADKPDPANPDKPQDNVYRFNAKRWDAAAGTYDMGFRDYDPGLNRYLTRDLYNGALADMNLATDPFTGNRYAFGGGNPVSFIEIDGHWGFSFSDIGHAVLDVAGLVPVVGEVADVANGIWYAAEGNPAASRAPAGRQPFVAEPPLSLTVGAGG